MIQPRYLINSEIGSLFARKPTIVSGFDLSSPSYSYLQSERSEFTLVKPDYFDWIFELENQFSKQLIPTEDSPYLTGILSRYSFKIAIVIPCRDGAAPMWDVRMYITFPFPMVPYDRLWRIGKEWTREDSETIPASIMARHHCWIESENQHRGTILVYLLRIYIFKCMSLGSPPFLCPTPGYRRSHPHNAIGGHSNWGEVIARISWRSMCQSQYFLWY
jgi:hypothetical protein